MYNYNKQRDVVFLIHKYLHTFLHFIKYNSYNTFDLLIFCI